MWVGAEEVVGGGVEEVGEVVGWGFWFVHGALPF